MIYGEDVSHIVSEEGIANLLLCRTTEEREQAIRGMRYKQYRPEIVILDDIEDVNSTRTREMREKIYIHHQTTAW